jgi:hypothetical protein
VTDISVTHDKVLQRLKDDGILPKEIPEENARELTDYLNQAIHGRFLALLPNINLGEDNRDLYVLREVRKVNDLAGINDIKRALDTATAATLEAVRKRPAWVKSGGLASLPPEAPSSRLHLIQALNGAVGQLFAEGIMWSECCGDDKAPNLYHYMQAAVSLRMLNRLPGFDTGNEIAAYDRKILLQIHEFNELPGVKDVERILDTAMDKVFEELQLQGLQRVSVLKPLQIIPKASGI